MASTSEKTVSPKKISRLTKNSKILKVITTAIQDRKGEHIVLLDLRKINEAVSDFFIICEASSTVQVRAIADWVETKVKKELGELPYRHEGQQASQWILVDYVNVVVHIFLSETRKFYKLEDMWNDGVEVELEEPSALPQPPAFKSVKKKNKQ
ncbi:MAG: ribosome silencing factor [Chitinophagaceae bacterium]